MTGSPLAFSVARWASLQRWKCSRRRGARRDRTLSTPRTAWAHPDPAQTEGRRAPCARGRRSVRSRLGRGDCTCSAKNARVRCQASAAATASYDLPVSLKNEWRVPAYTLIVASHTQLRKPAVELSTGARGEVLARVAAHDRTHAAHRFDRPRIGAIEGSDGAKPLVASTPRDRVAASHAEPDGTDAIRVDAGLRDEMIHRRGEVGNRRRVATGEHRTHQTGHAHSALWPVNRSTASAAYPSPAKRRVISRMLSLRPWTSWMTTTPGWGPAPSGIAR